MKLLLCSLTLSLLTVSAFATERGTFRLTSNARSGRVLFTLSANRAPLGAIVSDLSRQTGKRIEVESSRKSFPLTLVFTDASEGRLLEAIAQQSGLRVAPGSGGVRLQVAEPTASLDVKDEDVHVILRSLQTQCGVRNLVIDPNVAGKGTFLLRDLPCSDAFRVVFASLGLSGDFGANATGSVGIR